MQEIHGPQTLKQLAAMGVRRCQKKQNLNLAIFGDTGKGKSNVALLFALQADKKFNVRKQCVFSGPARDALIRRLPKGRAVWEDEALKSGGNRRRTMSTRNVEAQESSATSRKLGHIRIQVMPFMDDMDKGLLKHHHYVLKMEGIGRGTCYEVQKRGLKKTVIWLQPRFRFEAPFCGDLYPEEWKEYEDHVEDWLKTGGDDKTQVERDERREKHRAVLRRIMQVG